MAHEGQLLLHYIQRDAQAKINIPRAQLGGYFIYPFPLHVLHTEWRVIKEGGGNARALSLTPIHNSHPQRVVVVVGRIPRPRIKRVRNWELLRRMEFRQHRSQGRKREGEREMNGRANWPHFYFNVAEVGIIIGGGAGLTLLPLIDVLFSTLDPPPPSLGALTRPKSNAT